MLSHPHFVYPRPCLPLPSPGTSPGSSLWTLNRNLTSVAQNPPRSAKAQLARSRDMLFWGPGAWEARRRRKGRTVYLKEVSWTSNVTSRVPWRVVMGRGYRVNPIHLSALEGTSDCHETSGTEIIRIRGRSSRFSSRISKRFLAVGSRG